MLPKKVFPLPSLLLLMAFLLAGCYTSGIRVYKSGFPIYFERVGDQITYTYVVENAGTSELRDITLTDGSLSISCPGEALKANTSMTCTAVYTVTAADVAAGKVNTTARVSANGNVGCGGQVENVGSSDDFEVTLNSLPAISLTKTSDVTSFDQVGQQITFTYTVRNIGNAPITEAISVVDDRLDVICPSLAPSGLAPGNSLTCTGTYTVTLLDLRLFEITNTAFARAGEVVSEPVSLSISLDADPALTLVKSAVPNTYARIGEQITFNFVVTNSGNTYITTPVEVLDDSLAAWHCPDFVAGELAPGESITCTGTYTITTSDYGHSIENTATVRTRYWIDEFVSSNESSAVVFFLPPTPSPVTLTGCAQYTEQVLCDTNGCYWNGEECVSPP